jgi:hypothetical protein
MINCHPPNVLGKDYQEGGEPDLQLIMELTLKNCGPFFVETVVHICFVGNSTTL